MNSRAYTLKASIAALLLTLVSGCSDEGVACKDAARPVDYDRVLGPPIESVDADGCKIYKPRKRFDGEPVVEEWAWTSGGPVSVDAEKGNIEIVSGSGEGIKLTVRPFAALAEGAGSEEVRAAVEAHFFNVIQAAPSAQPFQGILLQSDSSASNTGADIRIELPPAFDGSLIVDHEDGSITSTFSGNSRHIDVSSHGACDLAIGPLAEHLNVYCAELTASLQDVPPGFVSASLWGSDGTATVAFDAVPVGRSYVVYANAFDGAVQTGSAESAGCVVSTHDESNKTIACGEDALSPPGHAYHVNAGQGGDVILSF